MHHVNHTAAALRGFFILVSALLAAAAPASAQGVYKCPGAGGQVVFQQAPCVQGGERVVVREGNVLDSQATANPGLLESAQRRSLVENGRLFEGMSPGEVRQVLGNPLAVNRSAGSYGTREQWVYRYPDGSRRFVYLRDGALDSVSSYESTRQPTRRERGDCPSELAIRNAGVGMHSTTLGPEERARRAEEVRRMRDCR
jgi:hypothetical protein